MKVKILLAIVMGLLLTACSSKVSKELDIRTIESTNISTNNIDTTEQLTEYKATTTANETNKKEKEVAKGTDYLIAYTDYLNNLDMYITGIYIADINNDGIQEVAIQENTWVVTDILYITNNELQVLSLKSDYIYVGITCVPEDNSIVFTPMVGHTETTQGYIESYIYKWSDRGYVLTTKLLGQVEDGSYLGKVNDEKVDSETFEAMVKDYSLDCRDNYSLPLIHAYEENFESYIREKFPDFNNWEMISWIKQKLFDKVFGDYKCILKKIS